MPASHPSSPAILEQVMQVDRHRLRKAWERLVRQGQARDATSPAVAAWRARAEASAALRGERQASVPPLDFDPELPITAHREELVELIRQRQTIVVCGETGSGKSTQLPKFCLEAGLGQAGLIGHTQPRRLAARAVSARLAEELGSRVGQLVGYKIRFSDSTQASTLIKLMTDGVLLAETQSDRWLDQYQALIIDEAHERSLNIDFLLGYLRRISGRRPDLKIIITSATIDPQRFAEHFSDEQGPAPIIEVSGRTYPVEHYYRPAAMMGDGGAVDEQAGLAAIAEAADELMNAGPGDILVFLPTERDIRLAAKHLRGHLTRIGDERAIEILPLYARLSQAEQNKIFAPHGRRRIVLSTNVAESSLTVPGIRYVIDTGLARISRYAPRSKVQRLPIEEISQASANQRSGRCGRLGPGICIRLFEESDFASRPRFTTPEIRRSDLASVLLQSLMLRLGPLEEFPLLDPPSGESIRDAQRTLRELDAIDARGDLTKIGRQLGQLPCEPRVGRMLLEAHERNCLAEVLIIAAGLECQDARQRPAGQRPEADAAHAKFLDPHSDFLSLLRLWDFFDQLRSDLSRSRLQKALAQNFLSYPTFREWADTIRQLKEILQSAGIRVGRRRFKLPPVELTAAEPAGRGRGGGRRAPERDSEEAAGVAKVPRPAGYAEIHQSLLSGLLSGVAQRGERHAYKAAGGVEIALWPGSGLFKRTPKWITAAEIVETTKRYGRTVAEVDVEWIEKAAEGLLKHSYSDPHWSRKTGSAMVYRRSTLYGLTISSGRRVPYAPIDAAAARAMLIEHGLVAGDWHCHEPFYRHNQELIADIHELAQRTRAREYIVDRFHLAAFYQTRIPADVTDLNTLRRWLKTGQGTAEVEGVWMQPHDLLSADEQVHTLEENFPNSLAVGSNEFPLAYHFEPGHAADGVTLTVPRVALKQISQEALAWLVPGLLEEKILTIIKALPKSLRTHFLPAPDVARKLAEQLAELPRDQAFSGALASAMSRHAGVDLRGQDLPLERLPEHLSFLVRVVDDDGHVIADSRDVRQLVQQYAVPETSSPPAEQRDQATAAWRDVAVSPADFDGIPPPVQVRRGGLLVAAFPALIDTGAAVELRLVHSQQEAESQTRAGLVRLFALKHHRSLRNQVAHLPGFAEANVQLSHVVGGQPLANHLQDLIARLAFLEGQPLLTTGEEFAAHNARAAGLISVATQDVAAWLPKLAAQTHALRLALEETPSLWREVQHDIQRQVDALFTADFLRTTAWEWLLEYPRYLQAARLRLEKLKNGGLPKDRKLVAPLQAVAERLSALANSPSAHDAEWSANWTKLRWLLEEWRVSVFAQQLGTKHSVSQKRIQELLDSLA